ncbi:helix-turn-helix domain-containing protein [Streptomyces sp. DT24]|uniref:helix-turn-helix domain-containing protein n=1 Tax=Streptomyces sp. DT24 TaxID=3416520 RepID=UPI003CF14368
MLRHVIAPSGRFTKASHDVVRHPRLSSDAKILLLYVQGLPDNAVGKSLGELARRLGIKGRAYQKAKQQLVEHGYVHEWRSQGDRGRWVTEQLLANLPLSDEAASGLREGPGERPGEGTGEGSSERSGVDSSPGVRFPAVGASTGRTVGGYEPVEEHCEKSTPHPPSEAHTRDEPDPALTLTITPAPITPDTEPEPVHVPESGTGPGARPEPEDAIEPAPAHDHELAEAEGLLLSLRHSHRQLHLGVIEARALAAEAVTWLRHGVSPSELRRVLTSELPDDGVRSAVGFLRHRLLHKLPEPPTPTLSPEPPPGAPQFPPVPELVTCDGPGEEHVFRPLTEETECAACRQAIAYENWRRGARPAEPPTEYTPWRERFARVYEAVGLPATEG